MPDDVAFPDKNVTFAPKSGQNQRFSGQCPPHLALIRLVHRHCQCKQLTSADAFLPFRQLHGQFLRLAFPFRSLSDHTGGKAGAATASGRSSGTRTTADPRSR